MPRPITNTPPSFQISLRSTIWLMTTVCLSLGWVLRVRESPGLSVPIVACWTLSIILLSRRLPILSVDRVGCGLGLYAWVTALVAVVTLYRSGFYSPGFPVFVILIWSAFAASIISFLLAAFSLIKHRRAHSLFILALPLTLYVAWVVLIHRQP